MDLQKSPPRKSVCLSAAAAALRTVVSDSVVATPTSNAQSEAKKQRRKEKKRRQRETKKMKKKMDAAATPSPNAGRGFDEEKTEVDNKKQKQKKKDRKMKKRITDDDATPSPNAGRGFDEETEVERVVSEDREAEKETSIEHEDKGKTPIKRTWTDQQEIDLLTNLIKFVDPGNQVSQQTDFYNFISESSIVHAFSADQVSNKMKHTRIKYQNRRKREKNGYVLRPYTSHEITCYELAKLIWNLDGETPTRKSGGKRKAAINAVKRMNGKKRKTSDSEKESDQVDDVANEEGFGLIQGKDHMDMVLSMPDKSLSDKVVEMIRPSKVMKLSKQWNNVEVVENKQLAAELQAFVGALNVVHDASMMLSEALQPSTSQA